MQRKNGHPAYVLHRPRFEQLLASSHESKSDFIARSGIPRRTLGDVLRADQELTGRTIRYFLDAFPGTSFEYLFYAPRQAEVRSRSNAA